LIITDSGVIDALRLHPCRLRRLTYETISEQGPPISPGVVVVIEGDDILRQVPQTDCRR
jgi:hypothetical protein